eukprot:CAMPEP_0184291880 /NCGR_PEP_ID=MMETSP1049-20130417/3757_1 /TAXON_ID=77928 /ORGANISM="Proteomonas sulcata, Strain CCMP704" /LENGTH=80 /DNA_ID=CAMNT_0026599437 /DNA_START=18 /DNA_END=260 /DNA_ORIENTATION=-
MARKLSQSSMVGEAKPRERRKSIEGSGGQNSIPGGKRSSTERDNGPAAPRRSSVERTSGNQSPPPRLGADPTNSTSRAEV